MSGFLPTIFPPKANVGWLCFNYLAGVVAALAISFATLLPASAELGIDGLRQTEKKIQDLSQRVMPSTVSLIPGGKQMRIGTGSGVVVSKQGLILTAAHVAMEMNNKVTVIFPDGSRANADVLGMDYSRDAAMLQITDGGEYPFVELGDSGAMSENDWCIALGHAGGFFADRSPPVRLGRVIENDPQEFLTSDSALIGGDSGGPLFDIDGKLIAIHSNIGFSLSQNRHVPISIFVENWQRLLKGDRFGGEHLGGMLRNPERPVIGALLEDAKKNAGAFIRSVVPLSPAEKAGLGPGDTVIGMGKQAIKNVADLMTAVDTHRVGDTLKLQVRKGEDERAVDVTLVAAQKLQSALEDGPSASDLLPEGHPGVKPKSGAGGKGKPKSSEATPAPKSDNAKTEGESDEAKAEAPMTKKERRAARKKAREQEAANANGKSEAEDAADSGKDETGGAMSKKERAALQAEFDKRMHDSIDAGELELSPEELERFGGPEGFADLLRDFQKRLTPADVAKLMRSFEQRDRIAPDQFDPDQAIEVTEQFFRDVLDAFHPAIHGASDATHLVFRGSEWKSLCTIVRADGYAVTKASEIETGNNQVLNVLVEKGRMVSAKVVHTWPKHDLALLKLELAADAAPMKAVKWQAGGESLPLGSLIAAAGSGPDPLAIGVISVQARTLSGGNKGFLGIGTDVDPNGVKVARVLPGGNAGKAGMEVGDVITRINDVVCDTPEKLIKEVSGTAPGDSVELHFLRGGKPQSKSIQLGDRGELDDMMSMGERGDRMNRFGTEISAKSTGFLRVVQTDLPIRPEQCGGPVCNLDGEVIGINIARAGRIKTYALPAADVARLVDEQLKRLDDALAPKKTASVQVN